jgi:leucyl/phenylalanyl-tRNA--protein transferase
MRTVLDLRRLDDDPEAPFPPVAAALEFPNGLLAWGGDLSPGRLLNAYRAGIFPWYSEGQPILWWSPAPRCVLFPEDVYLSRRTRRRYNSGAYSLSADTAFDRVIDACAGPRKSEPGTWITPEMATAYRLLHRMGFAHSFEAWHEGELVGGIYGLALGSVFFGESMFSHRTDAGKLTLVALCRQLKAWGFGLLDCQVGNPHLFRMGAVELPRRDFERLLQEHVHGPGTTGNWADRYSPEERW